MSTHESVIWHALGYSAMHVVILGGFLGMTLVSIAILSLTKRSRALESRALN